MMSMIASGMRFGQRPESATGWQQDLKEAVRDPYELCRLLGLPESLAAEASRSAGRFPLFVPRPYLSRMLPGDPDDPLLRQVLPRSNEQHVVEGFGSDPVGDLAASRRPGLLHKYAGRVLIVAVGACPVHCRYCFRRDFPYQSIARLAAGWEEACRDIAADVSLREVILSGGDPLVLPDESLAELVRRLAESPHLTRLRIHSRFPVVIPRRVTSKLIAWLAGTRLTPVVVIHVNHPAELDSAISEAIGRLVGAGVMVFNQAVLLAGVNDRLETLVALCERLIDLRVVPYYLHQLDRVAGAAHFEVSPDVGRRLVEGLRARLPGYAVPRYVREIAGAAYKLPLA
jgi:EF-P beta-lysylation protein EpmB